jgi:hypothetical protein
MARGFTPWVSTPALKISARIARVVLEIAVGDLAAATVAGAKDEDAHGSTASIAFGRFTKSEGGTRGCSLNSIHRKSTIDKFNGSAD